MSLSIEIPKVKPTIKVDSAINFEDFYFRLRNLYEMPPYRGFEFPLKVVGGVDLGRGLQTARLFIFHTDLANLEGGDNISTHDKIGEIQKFFID